MVKFYFLLSTIYFLPSVLLHISCDIPFLLGLLQFLSFVVLPFTSGKCQLDLRKPPAIEIYPKRNQRKTSLRKFYFDLMNLPAVQKQFPLSFRRMIRPGGLWIWRYLTADKPALVIFDTRERTVQIGLTIAQGLYLTADENHTGLELLDKLIVVIGLFVLDMDSSTAAVF